MSHSHCWCANVPNYLNLKPSNCIQNIGVHLFHLWLYLWLLYWISLCDPLPYSTELLAFPLVHIFCLVQSQSLQKWAAVFIRQVLMNPLYSTCPPQKQQTEVGGDQTRARRTLVHKFIRWTQTLLQCHDHFALFLLLFCPLEANFN